MFTNKEVGLIVLLENTCLRDNLLAQHGVSFRISYYGKKYLFDCWQIYEWLAHNLSILKIDLNDIESVIISHDHKDHCYALWKLLKNYPNLNLIVPEDFSSIKHNNITKASNAIRLEPGLFVTGSISWWNIKEQSLVIDLKKRWLIIITWCSHPWLESIVTKSIDITWNHKVAWIIGGLHLIGSSAKNIQKTIHFLKSLNLEFLIPWHCTGAEEITSIKKSLWDKIKSSPMGSIWTGNIMRFAPNFSFDMHWW